MKPLPLRANPSQLFLLFRRTIGLIVIGAAAAVAGFGAADIQQVDTQDIRQSMKQGNRHIRRGEYLDAEKIFDRLSKSYPQYSAAKLKLAFVYLKQRRLRDAYDLSFAVAKAEPENSYAFAVLGTTLLSAGKFPEARMIFANALKLNKKEALAWAGYGLLDFYENRIKDSIDSLFEAAFLEQDEPDYLFAFAQVAARAEKYTEAADAYHRFLAVSRNTDDERRARIKGLINFLRFLGQRQSLYITGGARSTSVPIKLMGNRPVIQIRLNGRSEPLNFVLDTGSGISVISDTTAKLLDIDPITRGGYAKGIGGDGRFEIVYGFVRQVAIGDVTVRNVPVYIRKFHTQGQTVDGYIGLSLISICLTTIDYGDLTFILEKDEPAP
jgi:tetratricopeptide (TPR) repeat protein